MHDMAHSKARHTPCALELRLRLSHKQVSKHLRQPCRIIAHTFSHVRSNNVAVVEVLLAAGARVDLKDADGWTAVHFAAKFNHVDALEKLLEVPAYLC